MGESENSQAAPTVSVWEEAYKKKQGRDDGWLEKEQRLHRFCNKPLDWYGPVTEGDIK